MTRCLRDKGLVELYEGEGRPADRAHLEGCARCAARYRRLEADLRVIRHVLEHDPVPRTFTARSAWPSLPAAVVALVVIVGLNALFAWQWFGERRAAERGRADHTTTEELVTVVEAMTAPEVEGQESAMPVDHESLAAQAARLYGGPEDDDLCQGSAFSVDDACEPDTLTDDAPGLTSLAFES